MIENQKAVETAIKGKIKFTVDGEAMEVELEKQMFANMREKANE